MSITISQTDNVGLTVESDPLALKKASNLSDLTSTTTARTNLGVAYATNAETITGTSTTTVITPDDLKWSQGRVTKFDVMPTYGTHWVTSTSGVGFTAGTSSFAGGKNLIGSVSQGVGYAYHYVYGMTTQKNVNVGNGSFNWAKAVSISFKIVVTNVAGDTNTIARILIGKGSNTGGDLINRGIGLRFIGGTPYYQLCVHDGTTLTIVNSSKFITQAGSVSVDFRITSDGAGNAKLYADDILVASTTGAPTTQGTGILSYISADVENIGTASGLYHSYSFYNMSVEWAN
ncbi:hypothetical protein EB001_26195 [bacterium]|nr:hypothetical protein [bacterium]